MLMWFTIQMESAAGLYGSVIFALDVEGSFSYSIFVFF